MEWRGRHAIGLGVKVTAGICSLIDQEVVEEQMKYMEASIISFHVAALNGYIPKNILDSEIHSSNLINCIFQGVVSNPELTLLNDETTSHSFYLNEKQY